MVEALTKGLILGLLLSLTIGPVFFALIQTSIQSGFKSGAWMALGIMFSDSFYILVAYFGISSLNIQEHDLKMWLGIIGGAIMVVFGISTFFKKAMIRRNIDNTDEKPGWLRYVMKGFALNGINPFVFIFWLGIASVVNFQESFSRSELFVYFIAIISVVFILDLTKAFLANRLRHYVTENIQRGLNKFVGSGLLIFGFYLIIMTYLGRI